MTTRISGRRRRTAVSVSSPVNADDSVDQLDRIVEILHQVNRTLPKTVLGGEELIALGGLITQINGALLTLTDLLSAPTPLRPHPAASGGHRRHPATTTTKRHQLATGLPGRLPRGLHIRPDAPRRPQAVPTGRSKRCVLVTRARIESTACTVDVPVPATASAAIPHLPVTAAVSVGQPERSVNPEPSYRRRGI